MNPAILRIIGKDAESWLERPLDEFLREFFAPGVARRILRGLRRVLKSEKPFALDSTPLRTARSLVSWSLRGTRLTGPRGGALGLLLLIDDVTSHLESEGLLRRANRALKVISECNQLLVRVTDEQRLLDDTCRLLVDSGGYRLAWVGMAEQNAARTVRPVAQAGFDEGYLQALRISWRDNEWGRGPTGTAIRTGQPTVCRNIQTDPHYAPWRAEASRRGYSSSIALPMLSGGAPLGALNIYSERPNAFDETEIGLLKELADDLAYGIDALRTRKQRDRAENALRQSEAQYRATIDAMGDAIHLVDRDLRIAFANRAFRKWTAELGIRPPIRGQTIFEAFPFLPDTVRQEYERVLQTGEVCVTDETSLVGDKAITTETRKIPVRRGRRVTHVVTVVRDFTARRQLEEAYRSVVDHSIQGIGIMQNERFAFVNPALADIFGWTREEMVAMTPDQVFGLLHPEEREPGRRRYADRLAGRPIPSRHQVRALRKDGRVCWLEIYGVAVQFRGRPATQFAIIDITDRKELEREIIEIGDRARERVAQDIHDDLGQRLSGTGFLAKALEETLQRRSLPEASDAHRITEHVRDATTRARELARGLIAVEVESGGLSGALDDLASRTETIHGISCRLRAVEPIPSPDPSIASHVYRIAQEAVTNAVKHSQAQRIDIDLRCSGGMLSLDVCDDGIGMSESREASPGLGMRLMRQRASVIGGYLQVRENVPRGTVVSCQVRVGPQTTSPPQAPARK